ncbi:MAG: head GIN domain-containing protein [Bacteroidota bacterium]
MKKICSLFLAFTFLSQFTFAQWKSEDRIRGNGNPTSEDRAVSGFDAILVKDGLDVYLHQSNEEKVTVEADDNLIGSIRTEVVGNKLVIHSDKYYTDYKTLRIDVWFKDLESITTSGGSDLAAEGTLRLDELTLSSSGGSDIELDVETGTLHCKSSGGSDIELTGTTKELHVQASGGSDIDADQLRSEYCWVKTSGGADASVHASQEVKVSASGSSDVDVRGGARVVSQSVSGSSDVNFR